MHAFCRDAPVSTLYANRGPIAPRRPQLGPCSTWEKVFHVEVFCAISGRLITADQPPAERRPDYERNAGESTGVRMQSMS